MNLECINAPKVAFWWIVLLVFAVLMYCFHGPVSGNDFWWHVKAGEWIWEHRTVPLNDIFSWCRAEVTIPWTAHEWLSEVLFYLIYSGLGEAGIYFFCLTMAAVLISCLLWEGRDLVRRNPLAGGCFFIFVSSVTAIFYYGRPHMFNFLFLWIELKCLYRHFNAPDSKAIYWLPALAFLWSNLHGGSSCMSYLLCGVFLAAELCQFRFGRICAVRHSGKSIARLFAVMILCIVGLLINPIGLRVMRLPYLNMADEISMGIISEWAPPVIGDIGQFILYFLPLILMVLGMLASEEEIRFVDLLVFGMFTYLFLKSVRFSLLFDVAAVFCAFRYIPGIKLKELRSLGERIVMGVVVAVTSLFLLFWTVKDFTRVYQNADTANAIVSAEMSKDMLAFVQQEKPERLFNDYNYGGELIFHEIPVFWDGRADMYAGVNILRDGVTLNYLKWADKRAAEQGCLDVEGLIQKYNFDAFLLIKDRQLATYLFSHPENYQVEFEVEDAVYFTVKE